MSTVRITHRSHQILKRISDRFGVSMIEALDMVTDRWEREEFLAAVNSAYGELKQNKEAWEEELRQREEWDDTLADGLGHGEDS